MAADEFGETSRPHEKAEWPCADGRAGRRPKVLRKNLGLYFDLFCRD
jgi:hypothetical protein